MLRSSGMLAASAMRAGDEARLADCHVYLCPNPFRQLGAVNPLIFIQYLVERGVRDDWAGAFEGLLL